MALGFDPSAHITFNRDWSGLTKGLSSLGSSLGGAIADRRAARYEEDLRQRQLQEELAAKRAQLLGYAQAEGKIGLPEGATMADFTQVAPLPELPPTMLPRADIRAARRLGRMTEPEGRPPSDLDETMMGPAGPILIEDIPEGEAGAPRAEMGAPPVEVPLIGESGRLEDISQDIGYLEGLTGMGGGGDLSYEEKLRLKQKYKTYAPQIIPADARKAKSATTEMMTVAGEVFKALDDPEIGELAGKYDQYIEGLGRLFGEGWTKDELGQKEAYKEWRKAAESAKLSTRSTTLVWKILRAIQGSRPSDFDMQVYEKTLKVVSQIRNPILAAETLASFIGDNYTSVLKDIREFGQEPVEGDPGFKNWRTFGQKLDELEGDWGGIQQYIPGTPEWHQRTGLSPEQLEAARTVETWPAGGTAAFQGGGGTPVERPDAPALPPLPEKKFRIEKQGSRPVEDKRSGRYKLPRETEEEAELEIEHQNRRAMAGKPIIDPGNYLDYSGDKDSRYFMVTERLELPNTLERGAAGNYPEDIILPAGSVVRLSVPDSKLYQAKLGLMTGVTQAELDKYTNPESEFFVGIADELEKEGTGQQIDVLGKKVKRPAQPPVVDLESERF